MLAATLPPVGLPAARRRIDDEPRIQYCSSGVIVAVRRAPGALGRHGGGLAAAARFEEMDKRPGPADISVSPGTMSPAGSVREGGGESAVKKPDLLTDRPRFSYSAGMQRDRREEFDLAAIPCLPSVSFLAERLLGPGPDAEDLVQETFLRAWASFDRFEPGTDARKWLVTIALNAFRDRMRRRGRDPISLETLPEAPAANPPDAPLLPLHEILDDRLARALDRLPEASRAVLTLSVIEGIPAREIARMMGCPEGTVRSLICRAKAELRTRLAPGNPPAR